MKKKPNKSASLLRAYTNLRARASANLECTLKGMYRQNIALFYLRKDVRTVTVHRRLAFI
jgi:hypothetical protein